MSDKFVYKIKKAGEADKWVKWSEAEKLVAHDGWEFVMDGANYTFRPSSC